VRERGGAGGVQSHILVLLETSTPREGLRLSGFFWASSWEASFGFPSTR
jgi:hypothetical protein